MAWKTVPKPVNFEVSFENVLISREPISLINVAIFVIGAFVKADYLPCDLEGHKTCRVQPPTPLRDQSYQ